MKKNIKHQFYLWITLLIILPNFTNAFSMRKAKLVLFPSTKSIDEINTTTDTLRGLIDSGTAGIMIISNNGLGHAIITTSNVAPNTVDINIIILDSSLVVDTLNKQFTIPYNIKYWAVPFDGSAPMMISNMAGGGGGSNPVHYTWYCPCTVKTCIDVCTPGFMILPGRGYCPTCKNISQCAESCIPYACKTGGALNYTGASVYIIKANSITLNGVLYN